MNFDKNDFVRTIEVAPRMPVVKKKKNEKRHNFVFEGHSNLFRMLRWTGLVPIERDKQGLISHKLNLTSVYSLLLSLSIFTWGCFVALDVVEVLRIYDVPEGIAGPVACMCLAPFYEATMLLALFDVKNLARLLNRWDIFQELYEAATNLPFRPKLYRSWPIWSLLTFFSIVPLTIMKAVAMDSELEPLNIPSAAMTTIALHAIPLTFILNGYLCLWVLLTAAVGKASHVVFTLLQKATCDGKLSKQRLDDYRVLLLNVRGQCVGIGDAMGVKLLYICALMFLMSLPAIYFGARNLAIKHDVTVLLSSVTTLLYITVAAEYSHQAVQKTGVELERGITELIASGKAGNFQRELLQLLQDIQTAPVYVSLLGFFNIDRGVNIPLYSSVITYMIIIVQMSSAENQPCICPKFSNITDAQ